MADVSLSEQDLKCALQAIEEWSKLMIDDDGRWTRLAEPVMSVREDLAALIAAVLDSSVDETELALTVGSTPTDVDYEVADVILERFAVTARS